MNRFLPRGGPALLLLLALLLSGCPRPGPELPAPTPLDDGEARALRMVQRICDLSRESGEAIWPGYAPHEMPLLVFRPNRRSFLVNPDLPPDGLEEVRVPWLTERVWALPSRSLAVSPNLPFAKDFPVAGQAAFLVRHLDRTKEESFFRLVVHELFHHYQQLAWEPRDFPAACRYPYEDSGNGYVARVEEKLLALMLATLGHERLGERVEEYVAVRLARYAMAGDEAAADIEEWEELTEGTARYVEEMYAVRAGFSDRERLTEELVAYFRHLHPKDLQKWKYYRTGATLALALDALGLTAWKESCTAGMGPFRFLEEAVGPRLGEEAAARVKAVLEQHAGEREEVAAKLTEYLAVEAETKEAWRAEGGYRVLLVFPERGTAYYTNRGITFQIEECYRLASGVVSFVDRRYGLEIQQRGVAMANRDEGYHALFHHDLEEGTLRLDDQAVPLVPGTRTFTRNLNATYPDFRLVFSGSGSVQVTDDTVTITIETAE
jgi:hypothetical protein